MPNDKLLVLMPVFNDWAACGQLLVALDDVLADIRLRDARDSQRAAAPLVRAEDAVLLDTSEMSISQAADVARRIVEAARARWMKVQGYYTRAVSRSRGCYAQVLRLRPSARNPLTPRAFARACIRTPAPRIRKTRTAYG